MRVDVNVSGTAGVVSDVGGSSSSYHPAVETTAAGPGDEQVVAARHGRGRDMDLAIEVVRRGAEVAFAGRLDGRNAPVARAVLHSTIDEGEGDVVVHLGGLDIWDASGLGVIVGAHRRAQQAGRRLVLADVPQRQLRLLRATRLHKVLTVEPLVA